MIDTGIYDNGFDYLVKWILGVCKKFYQKQAPSLCSTEAQESNSTDQEHHQYDAAQYFGSYDDAIVETPVHDNQDNALAMERDNSTLCIKQPAGWMQFMADNSYNSNNEDLKK